MNQIPLSEQDEPVSKLNRQTQHDNINLKREKQFRRRKRQIAITNTRHLPTGYSAVYSVIHFLCAIKLNGHWFDVLESGDPHYWVFVPLYSTTNSEGESIPISTAKGEPFPILRSRLPDEVQTFLNGLLHGRPIPITDPVYQYPEGRTWYASYDPMTNILEWVDPFPLSTCDLRYYERLAELPAGTRFVGRDGVCGVIVEYAGGGGLDYVCKTKYGLTRYSEHLMTEITPPA